MPERIVVDSNVFISALRSHGGTSRALLRLCLKRRAEPVIGEKLYRELEDVVGRSELFAESLLGTDEREDLLNAFLSVCRWVDVFYLWRPNLPDEGDNHLIELALAGGATAVVTHNVRDLGRGELRFPQVAVETPTEFMKRWRRTHGDDDDQTA